eukprot:3905241-Pyramimonas_sp.AAC.1
MVGGKSLRGRVGEPNSHWVERAGCLGRVPGWMSEWRGRPVESSVPEMPPYSPRCLKMPPTMLQEASRPPQSDSEWPQGLPSEPPNKPKSVNN